MGTERQTMPHWMIRDLEIRNFKSIKHQKIQCKRINVFLGKPNVGKSNVLEAVSLLGGYNSTQSTKYLSEYIRYESFRNLFYDSDKALQLTVQCNLGFVLARFHSSQINQFDVLYGHNSRLLNDFREYRPADYNISALEKHLDELLAQNKRRPFPWAVRPFYLSLNNSGQILYQKQRENKFWGNIKKYTYKADIKLDDLSSDFLRVPHGENAFKLIETNPKIFDEFAEIFKQYNLKLLFDSDTGVLEIFKTVDNRNYKIPYSLCADTLKRYLFYILAIRSNRQSVLIFEEPEAHSFPPYVSSIADEIIGSAENQFFIATHSPYLLTDLIEKCPPTELQLFVTSYKNYESIFRSLTRKEIKNIIENGIDLFFNLPAFNGD